MELFGDVALADELHDFAQRINVSPRIKVITLDDFGGDKRHLFDEQFAVGILRDFRHADVDNFDTAVKQNNGRARKVDPSILKKTHIGCANQMHRILRYSDGHNLVGGDVWIYFGSTNTGDAKMANSPNGGKYIEDFCAVKCKSAGKDFEDYDELMSKKVKLYDKDGNEVGEVALKDKINKYIPLESERF